MYWYWAMKKCHILWFYPYCLTLAQTEAKKHPLVLKIYELLGKIHGYLLLYNSSSLMESGRVTTGVSGTLWNKFEWLYMGWKYQSSKNRHTMQTYLHCEYSLLMRRACTLEWGKTLKNATLGSRQNHPILHLSHTLVQSDALKMDRPFFH